MGAVWLLIAATLRRRRRVLVGLAIASALSSGFVVTAANGAWRTKTSWDRLNVRTKGADALVSVLGADVDRARKAILADPDVDAAGAFTWAPVVVKGMPGAENMGLFGALGPGFNDTVWRSLVERGRLADPGRPDEITVNQPYAELGRLEVGDRVELVGPGVDQPATVVGIHRSPLDIGPNAGAPSALATPAFMARWHDTFARLPGFTDARPAIVLRVAHHADLPAVLHRLQTKLPAGAGIVDKAALDSDIRPGIDSATTAYLILFGASAVAAVVLLALLAGRSLGRREADTGVLSALGYTRGQRAVGMAAPLVVALAAGTAVSPAIAAALSPEVRTGLVRSIDPVSGVWVDWPVVVGAAAVLALVTAALVSVVAVRASIVRPPAQPPVRRPSLLARASRVTPSATLGAIAVFGGTAPAARRRATSTLLGCAAVLAGVIATLGWRSSIDSLERHPRLQGWSFDAAAVGVADSGQADFDKARAALRSSAGILGAVAYDQYVPLYHGTDVDLFALADVKGRVDPIVESGRAPVRAGEALAAGDFLRAYHLHVGDTITMAGDHGPLPITLVGRTVFPLLGNTGFGDTLIVDQATGDELHVGPLNAGFLLELAQGVSIESAQALLGAEMAVNPPSSPPPIVRIRDVRGIVAALTLFLGAFAVAVFGFGVVAGGHDQRGDYAVARALGLRRRQVVAAYGWHAAMAASICALVAAPLGVAAGRVAWTATAGNLSILDAFAVGPSGLARAAAVAAASAALIALVAAAGAIRPSVADLLRSE